LLGRILVAVGLLVAAVSAWSGLDYYLTPLTARPFSPLHELYAPTGLIGQGFGIVGSIMIIVGVTMYTARKRFRVMARIGKLKHWLEVHIFLCTLGPFLVLLHTTFKFGGLVSISFWSMALVVASGIFGRYVYVWIPKTLNGRFLSAREMEEQKQELLHKVEEDAGISRAELAHLVGTAPPPDKTGIVRAVGRSLQHRWGRKRRTRRLSSDLAALGVTNPLLSDLVGRLEKESRVQQQILLVKPFQRAFRYWHAFHLPLAGVMMLVLAIHVGVAIAFGYTWIFAGSGG
jgi:hypothetical protein